ncbi:MAG: nucleotide exchange factor GrpE [Cyanobacteria bacterium J06642_2]
MTQEDKTPLQPEDSYPELEDERELAPAELEELIQDVAALSEDKSTAPVDAQLAETRAAVAKLQRESDILRQQLKEKEENYMRLYADFDNFRKRTQREKEELSSREKSRAIGDILPVVDNFERAQQAIKVETEAEEKIHNSYQSLYRDFVNILKKMGVARMKTVGEVFDPNLHDAAMQQPTNEAAEGTILSEYQPGYLLGDRVLRHAMVTVATGGEGSSIPTDTAVNIASESNEAGTTEPASPDPGAPAHAASAEEG